MRFAHDFSNPIVILIAILCVAIVLGYAAMLVIASIARARAVKRFGDPNLIQELETFDAAPRRALKGVLLVFAMALAFAAFARPQFGRGTRLIPATNLDVVIVMDYSKSMYARDITPSRMARAKAEIAQLIRGLPGARFAAVAFAGEPMSFPLSSDGAAIAQFFRQLEPNDMPVGGTATQRALERARELLARDPKSKEHVRVIVLVTDGEDLEGDPVSVARACQSEGTRIDVVQIGGRAPEVIPEVGPDGRVIGIRKDEDNKPLTTSLSADGEKQLASVAETTGGTIVRSEGGATGIDTIARGLSKMMREELSEKVETVYAEEFTWPLGLAVLLLIVEAFVGEAPARKRKGAYKIAEKTPQKTQKLGRNAARAARASNAASLLCLAFWLAFFVTGCDASKIFEREAPEVNEAIGHLDAGDAGAAANVLEEYLSTGGCNEGSIGVPDTLKRKPNGTFDLGLALFRIGESYGRRFGEEELDGGAPDPSRTAQVDCALRVVKAIASDESAAIDLRARARYLEGNLQFLNREYEEAVRAYDAALILAPGQDDAGDPIGRDAAFNRAIALRRIDDKRDAGQDANDSSNDAASDARDSGNDANDAAQESGPEGGKDSGNDSGNNGQDSGQESGDDGGNDASSPPPSGPDAGQQPPEPPPPNQEERVLDQLENAPTLQQEAAKRHAERRRTRGMADK